jgi:hypothetical protein
MRAALALVALLLASPAVPQTMPPGYSNSVADSGISGLLNGHLLLFNAPPSWDPSQVLRVDRRISKGSGTSGYTYNALYATCTTNGQNAGFEWCGTFESHNTARSSTGAQNVAINGTMWRDATDNGEEPSSSWAGNFNCVDTIGKPNPTTACIGAEIDIGGAVGTDANRQRVVIHAAGGGQPGSHVGYGVMVSPIPDVTIDRAFSTANVNGSFGIGLDLAGASFSGAAILMGKGQWFGIDGDASGNFSRFFGFNPADDTLTYMTSGGPMLRFSDDGAARVGRIIQTIPHVPASKNATCETGEQAYDKAFFYLCVAPNRWKRAALSDW